MVATQSHPLEEALLTEPFVLLLLHLEHVAPIIKQVVVVAVLQVADFVEEAGNGQRHLLLLG